MIHLARFSAEHYLIDEKWLFLFFIVESICKWYIEEFLDISRFYFEVLVQP